MANTATTERVYVTRTPGVLGGKPCVAGHRISVELIAILTEEGGHTPDEIVAMYPSLTLAEIHGALAYYFDHKQEIDAAIMESDRKVRELRRATGPGPFEQLMRKERQSDDSVSS